MCGIVGWMGSGPTEPLAVLVPGMLDAIAHRGPDGEGTYFGSAGDRSYEIGFGHRRLAIIDLVTGQQPMVGPDGAVVTFNGEIYNFRELRHELERAGFVFRTSGDTEVLLHGYTHWGDTVVDRLRGMFAFALWDRRRDRVLLARDPFGKKPLFLARQGGALAFASEIKALLVL